MASGLAESLALRFRELQVKELSDPDRRTEAEPTAHSPAPLEAVTQPCTRIVRTEGFSANQPEVPGRCPSPRRLANAALPGP
jgi:hypothetical protein